MRYFIIWLPTVLFISYSCGKSNIHPKGSASVTVVNALSGSNPLLLNFSGTSGGKATDSFSLYDEEYENTGGVGFGSSVELGSYSGVTQIAIVQVSDTFKVLFAGVFNFSASSIYSLFLIGSDTLHIDTLFAKDDVPYYPYSGDSLAGVRFVNLVEGSSPASVDIQASPSNMPVLSSLAYKSVSGFQSFSANMNAVNNGYTFEFRDAVSGNLLATYPLTVLPFKSQTLALYGNPLVGISVMEINNY